MHNLIKPVFRTLSLDKEKTANCVLIRHSIRYPINDNKMAFDAGLTPDGVKLALEFGKYLNWYKQPGTLYSSPVGRCIDTAIKISVGAKCGRNVLPDFRLSHAYIAEPLFQLSTYKPGQPLPEKIWKILYLLLDDNSHGLTIAVTHDTVLVCLVAYLLGVPIDPDNWPGYFEGIVFWKEKNKLVLGWREKLYDFPALAKK